MASAFGACFGRPTGLLLAAALALASAGCHAQPAAPAAGPDRVWVQLTDRGAEARLVTSAAACPAIVADGRSIPMSRRAARSPDFPMTVCEVLLPAGAQSAGLAGQPLPLPKPRPDRILIFGDTGCRLKGLAVQKCDNPASDPRAWPFALVARLAAAHHPDLVIHVGDYYYRESPCPAGAAGCAGSPWGDNWTTWDADFFAPATPLLAAAPWVMTRGNHESCVRGGPGWFRLLDAAPAPLTCPAASAAYAVPIGGLNLYILDSADTEDTSAPPAVVARFSAQLDALKAQLATQPGWIVTHRPFWGLTPVARMGLFGPLEVGLNATEQAAARDRNLSAVEMIVSGHIHHFASFDFGPKRPPQLIVGTGGDVGEPNDTPQFRTEVPVMDGLRAKNFGFDRYGFLILERDGHAWNGAFYDLDDKVITRCRLSGRDLACAPA